MTTLNAFIEPGTLLTQLAAALQVASSATERLTLAEKKLEECQRREEALKKSLQAMTQAASEQLDEVKRQMTKVAAIRKDYNLLKHKHEVYIAHLGSCPAHEMGPASADIFGGVAS
ncbi:hypothetical protein HDV00_001000 [Rhizophlyctis rosea]|nr:hypothetical protein HDV00_001000 [Rhizophlyctis rosea]